MSRQSVTGERLIFLFLIGVLLFNPPMLSIFNVPEYLFGIPLLYIYLFACWGVLLLFLAIIIEFGADSDQRWDARKESASGDETG